MARAYTLNIAADTRAVKVGIDKGVIEPLEDALEVLEDIGQDGGRDLDKLEDAARDAQDQTEKVKREFSDLAKEIRETGRKAKTDFANKYEDAADDVSEALDQVKDDGFSNAKEVAASFDGSAESIVEGFQGAAAEAFSGFGPAGAIAGLAAAAGIGLVTQELTKQQEEAEETKQALLDMYREAIDEGRNYLSEAQILAGLTDIVLDPEKMKRYRDEAALIGVDIETYIRGQAGSYDDLKLVVEATQKAEADRLAELRQAGVRIQSDLDSEVVMIGNVREATENLIAQHEANAEAVELVAEARENSEKRQREQISRTQAADQGRYEAAARRYGVTLPSAVVPITADTSAADRAVRSFLQTPRRLKIDIEGRLANGQRVI